MKTMELIKHLEKYPKNELINIDYFFKTINKDGKMDRKNFNVQIARAVKDGKIQRFRRGQYYMGVKTPFGLTKPNVVKMLKEDYLGDMNKPKGFYGEQALMNQLGITDLEPNIQTIYTINPTVRTWTRKMNFKIKKAPIELNKDNFEYYKILFLLNDAKKFEVNNTRFKQIIAHYIVERDLSMEKLLAMSTYFKGIKVLKNLQGVSKELVV